MNTMKKIAGKLTYVLGQVISFILNVLINIVDTIVTLTRNIRKGMMAFLGMGGCLLLMMLGGPLGIALLMNPTSMLIILFFIIFPILGTKFVSYLKYVKYMVTEFLFDYSFYLIDGKKKVFDSFNEYGDKYKKMEEERRRKEQEQRQAQNQKAWEDRFRQWNEYQRSQGGASGYSSTNPTSEFKSKYEKSCSILGVSIDSDKYEIKLAYRKKAKEYHPDINKSSNATKVFQEINDAYEFLNDNNIDRYKGLR
ncbi:DnaJ domain-containing protein [Alkalibaculum sp. M08DMB]|uniref:DnaJ domain-containing protein n=1 Tax=Alkalibaculum sporogenes TaxID=2655001 RepID=A0A6A7KCI5_9FIRM|nr:DnaJ domain-containing protein [Alkalibaculum sporogenes]MPW27250.1 DnaJ domain-containing protein [Alkalibaculum sporogenes]